MPLNQTQILKLQSRFYLSPPEKSTSPVAQVEAFKADRCKPCVYSLSVDVLWWPIELCDNRSFFLGVGFKLFTWFLPCCSSFADSSSFCCVDIAVEFAEHNSIQKFRRIRSEQFLLCHLMMDYRWWNDPLAFCICDGNFKHVQVGYRMAGIASSIS